MLSPWPTGKASRRRSSALRHHVFDQRRSATTGSSATARSPRCVAPRRLVDWMCVPRFDSPSVFGAILGRHAGVVPGRAGRRHRAGGRPLPARHDDPGDQLGHADRLDHRPRRAADRAVAPRRRTGPRPTAARRTTTRPSTSCCAPSAASPARCRRSMDCEPVLDYGREPRPLGVHRRQLPPGRSARPRASTSS